MLKHEEKSCPRCGTTFECKVGDIANCQCSTVTISQKTDKFLSKTYFDCLCKNCLKAIDREVNSSLAYQFPTQKEMLIYRLHFYIDNSEIVYTPLYHILRGDCCRKNCRHCVYGYKEKTTEPEVLSVTSECRK